jgi:fructokinase
MDTAAPHVLAIGETLWDLFPYGPRFGGATANFACHAAALGCRVSLISRVGHDDYGRDARSFLERQAVDLACLQVDPTRPTGTVVVSLNAAGQPTYEITQDVAWDHLEWSPQIEAAAAHCDAICFGTLGQRHATSRATIQRLLTESRSARIRLLDINLRAPFFDDARIEQSLGWANALKLNEDELPHVARILELPSAPAEAIVALQRRLELEFVILTCGADGSWLVTKNLCHRLEGQKVEVADTVGAGDAFTATLLRGWLAGMPAEQSHRWAQQVASWVCTQQGAVPAWPEPLRQGPLATL